MNRYATVPFNDVEPGLKVRATLRHPDNWSTLTYEGPVTSTFDKPSRPGILAGFWGVGGLQFFFDTTETWHVTRVERSLPPLPTKTGSVVKCSNGLAAVLTNRVDEPFGAWVYASDGSDVPKHLLESAEVLFTAP